MKASSLSHTRGESARPFHMLPIRVLLKSAIVGCLLYPLPHGLSHSENLQSDKGLNGEDTVDHIQDQEEQ